MKTSAISVKDHTGPILAGILFLITYIPTLFWMWDRWFVRDSYYTHGILIPFVTAFLIWQRREELVTLKSESSNSGLWLIVVGILIHVISSILRVYFSSGFSMIIVLAGLVIYFYGLDVLKEILFPIFFLIFMIPVPEIVITNISFNMKLFAAQISTILLNDMGMPAMREGSLIHMRNANVMVEDVCSGLRSLISLTALGSIFAYWIKTSIWKRILLFFCTIPIAVVTNVCRILFLCFVSDVWGPEAASGFIHDLSGFIVFGVAFLLLYTLGRLLE